MHIRDIIGVFSLFVVFCGIATLPIEGLEWLAVSVAMSGQIIGVFCFIDSPARHLTMMLVIGFWVLELFLLLPEVFGFRYVLATSMIAVAISFIVFLGRAFYQEAISDSMEKPSL